MHTGLQTRRLWKEIKALICPSLLKHKITSSTLKVAWLPPLYLFNHFTLLDFYRQLIPTNVLQIVTCVSQEEKLEAPEGVAHCIHPRRSKWRIAITEPGPESAALTITLSKQAHTVRHLCFSCTHKSEQMSEWHVVISLSRNYSDNMHNAGVISIREQTHSRSL